MTRALVVLGALVAHAAVAAEVLRTEGGTKLEVQGFAKSSVNAVWFQPGLVEGSRALAKVMAEAGAVAPPTLPEAGLLTAQLVRLGARLEFFERFEFEAAWQLQVVNGSTPLLVQGASLASTVGGLGAGAQRRLWEGAGTLAAGESVRVDHNLDRLAMKLALPFGDLTVGRQVLSWGTGRFWNPTDVLSPFPPTAIDREVRRGFDAVRLAVALGELTQLDLLFLPQQRLEDLGGVARLQTNLAGWDASLSIGRYVRDVVIGADVAGDLGPLGAHAEGAYTLELLGLDGQSPVRVGEHFFRGVVGLDGRPMESLLLFAEYAFNGYGTNDSSQIARVLSSARVVRGEIFGAGRHLGALGLAWLATDLLTTQLTCLVNLTDPSVMLIPSLEYSLGQRVLLRFGGSVPIGATPSLAALTPDDVLQNSPAFQSAVATRGLRSEHGSSPWGLFAQVGVYLP